MKGLIVDNFAGGGGASLGIELALGRSPDIAVDHNAEALAMHEANHPNTRHYCEDVFDVNPVEVCSGRPVDLAWFSPDCTFFSKSRGGRPFLDRHEARRRRGLAWVAVKWARAVRPRVILLENVAEFQDWGPLGEDGRPCPERRGVTFRRWLGQLQDIGYRVEWRQLRACDYGVPTIRKRLFVVARCDGQPIVWPAPSNGPGCAAPYRTAAECIDWSIPCPSIFDRRKPLAPATLRRVARGIFKYVLGPGEPFVAPIGGHDAALTMIQTGRGERHGQAPRALDLQAPLGTVCAGGAKHALVAAFLAKHYGGHESPGASLTMPMSTITTQDHHHLVEVFIGTARDHRERVGAFLRSYYGSDQQALVTVAGQEHVIVDIGMRMLEPHELAAAQGFPPSYQLATVVDGKPLSKTVQIRCIGNSVCPPVAAALVRANVTW